ncbi:unnamed protein product [Kuraishia capsulata CBS 1993]|uniref:Uncharacterized protein n=1 Tax=Kuraishia capsulata CBS 1993 TaxID=1382522 RepID=W6MLZ1_9ASCO|nr:uncharacterized protein KUCA_T00003517001 [Kuraishia capsulata CBS 1993]CDK27539.1 unnamed protein product [Kuraishia capsulata CBS 1993]
MTSSGLASRWAADETLVKKAQIQDKAPARKQAVSKSDKPAKVVTSLKGAPLASKWASGPEERKSFDAQEGTLQRSREPRRQRKNHKNSKDGFKHEVQEPTNLNETVKSPKKTAAPVPEPHSEEHWEDEQTDEEEEDVQKPISELSKDAQDLAARFGVLSSDFKGRSEPKVTSKSGKGRIRNEEKHGERPSRGVKPDRLEKSEKPSKPSKLGQFKTHLNDRAHKGPEHETFRDAAKRGERERGLAKSREEKAKPKQKPQRAKEAGTVQEVDAKTFEERQREFEKMIADFSTSGNWADDEDF